MSLLKRSIADLHKISNYSRTSTKRPLSLYSSQDFSSRPCSADPYTLLLLKPPYNDYLQLILPQGGREVQLNCSRLVASFNCAYLLFSH